MTPDNFNASRHAAFPAQQSHIQKLTSSIRPHHQHLKIAR
jgi:hypothetical protein